MKKVELTYTNDVTYIRHCQLLNAAGIPIQTSDNKDSRTITISGKDFDKLNSILK